MKRWVSPVVPADSYSLACETIRFSSTVLLNAVRTQIRDTMGELDFDEAGCPLLDRNIAIAH